MRNNKIIKRRCFNKKNILGLGILICFLGIITYTFLNKKQKLGSDYKIGILADDGISLVSISKERKMINILKIGNDVQIWIPGGMGWYRNSVIKKFLLQEKKLEVFSDIIFYNFGFKVDKVLFLKKTDEWRNKFWWKLIFYNNNYLTKEEFLDKNIDQSDDFLDEVMIRDFSETKIIKEELKLSVINTTNIGGLANFMTKRIERSGFLVVFVGNDTDKVIENCLLVFGRGVKNTYSWEMLNDQFKCDQKEDLELGEGEIEIYFGDNFASMIKYPSYNK